MSCARGRLTTRSRAVRIRSTSMRRRARARCSRGCRCAAPTTCRCAACAAGAAARACRGALYLGTHEALSSYRVTPIAMATGHAAGVCAALAARGGAATGGRARVRRAARAACAGGEPAGRTDLTGGSADPRPQRERDGLLGTAPETEARRPHRVRSCARSALGRPRRRCPRPRAGPAAAPAAARPGAPAPSHRRAGGSSAAQRSADAGRVPLRSASGSQPFPRTRSRRAERGRRARARTPTRPGRARAPKKPTSPGLATTTCWPRTGRRSASPHSAAAPTPAQLTTTRAPSAAAAGDSTSRSVNTPPSRTKRSARYRR